jgi:hypothetical protein
MDLLPALTLAGVTPYHHVMAGLDPAIPML